ncbi:MAG: hypothetical protein CMG46_02765 [Candidatus Marinimicrobia bacterium]|nr:hypothetical protein [Candidatus Neomarinimicrobiota bacterium]|tara:strand:- start:564 stop:1694 length:1131 start_codon:yes stop_codon:yes gene_type:complete
MHVNRNDIEKYINNNNHLNRIKTYNELIELYSVTSQPEKYVLENIINTYIDRLEKAKTLYNERRVKLDRLKRLELPEQRSAEWYEMRKEKLTASALADALDKGHFQSRDELILSKIEEKPFEPNPITEWGVKYEDIAIVFYEELYNVKVLDFGLIPHPEFDAFGASPDGICDDTGNDKYLGRMVEIKCPPKRKFTKTVPPHYLMQVQGQLEVCDLDECDFFQVKIEEYEDYEDYCKDIFEIDGVLQDGRTHLNYPKGVIITCKEGEKLSYTYSKINQSNQTLEEWVEGHKETMENIHEIKWWKITRYECTFVQRDKEWWYDIMDQILLFYKDLLLYKSDESELKKLKERVALKKKRKKKFEIKLMDQFQLISDDED